MAGAEPDAEAAVEYPVYLEYDASPSKPGILEQHLADKLTGETTTTHDVLYGRADASAAPDIDTLPDAAFVYGVRESGAVFLAGVAVEGEGLVYQHDDFDLDAYRERRAEEGDD